MKIEIYPHNGRTMARARIPISKKHGIKARRQKTWCVLDHYHPGIESDIRPMVVKEAKRWQERTLAKMFGGATPAMPEPTLL